MEFGRLERKHIENINFSLPPDDPVTERLWQQLGGAGSAPLGAVGTAPLRLYVGGTGWGQPHWVGKVYPRGTKPKDFLVQYGRQFNSIELNALWYNLQPKSVIERWSAQVDTQFRFCPKISKPARITKYITGRELLCPQVDQL